MIGNIFFFTVFENNPEKVTKYVDEVSSLTNSFVTRSSSERAKKKRRKKTIERKKDNIKANLCFFKHLT